jgi:lipoyl-dependent peroxiredoxin
MKLGSGAFEGPNSFSSRFEEAKGTNPEELIGTAEAGCYSMALSANLEKAGHPAKRISTTATVKLEMVGRGPKITTIDLKTEAEGNRRRQISRAVRAHKENLPGISRSGRRAD